MAALTEGQAEDIRRVRRSVRQLRGILWELPEGRSRSTALTRLDECEMWALKDVVDAGLSPEAR